MKKKTLMSLFTLIFLVCFSTNYLYAACEKCGCNKKRKKQLRLASKLVKYVILSAKTKKTVLAVKVNQKILLVAKKNFL